jgi:hypothetical protein
MNELKDSEENAELQDIDGFRARLQFLFWTQRTLAPQILTKNLITNLLISWEM